jgi:hypothetical protein
LIKQKGGQKMKIDLLENGEVIRFNGLPIIAGVTTTRFGNFRSSDLNFKKRTEELAEFFEAELYSVLVPNHGTIIKTGYSRNGNEALVGDCIIYLDGLGGVLALIHCSWATLSKGILENSLAIYSEMARGIVGETKAFIYPGICEKCYEVDDLVLNSFKDYDRKSFVDGKKGHYNFSLSNCILNRLKRQGFSEKNLQIGYTCSAHQIFYEKQSLLVREFVFYSYRARKEMERNAVFVKIPGDNRLLLSSTGDCPYVILYKLC